MTLAAPVTPRRCGTIYTGATLLEAARQIQVRQRLERAERAADADAVFLLDGRQHHEHPEARARP